MNHVFTKVHATGNDFLVFKEPPHHPSEVAKKLCHRRFGFGADGILYPSSSEVADLKMNYHNADGSVATMCGNGYRAFIAFALKEGLLQGTHFKIETLAGIIESELCSDGEIQLTFNTFHHDVKPPHVMKPTSFTQPLMLLEKQMHVCFVGTLHGVVFVEDPSLISDELAHALCTHEFFPHHINVNFVKIVDSHQLIVKTYERGVGWTYSCGTGSVASAVAAHELAGCQSRLTIEVLGGQLEVSKQHNGWSLKGPATIVGQGESI
jgi:diaminopimelate epimerase